MGSRFGAYSHRYLNFPDAVSVRRFSCDDPVIHGPYMPLRHRILALPKLRSFRPIIEALLSVWKLTVLVRVPAEAGADHNAEARTWLVVTVELLPGWG